MNADPAGPEEIPVIDVSGLRARGAPPTSILAGIRPGDPDVAMITFAARVERQAKISFESLVR